MSNETENVSSSPNISATSDSRSEYSCRNHPDNLMTFQMYLRFDTTVQCGFIPILFFIAAPGNILTMIIFYRQGLRDRMNLCLFFLAFVDLMYVTSLFVLVSYCFVGAFLPDLEQAWKWNIIKRTGNLIYGFGYSSGCLTMIIAIERCVCVMFPMKAATLIRAKTMAVIVSSAFVAIHILCGVYVIKEEVAKVEVDVSGKTMLVAGYSYLYATFRFLKIVEDIVLPSFPFFSFTVVLLATAITVFKLHGAIVWRNATASCVSRLKGQVVLIRMLVVVSCIYILCAVPTVSLALTRFAVPEFSAAGLYCNLFLAMHLTGHLTVMLNSSINFFVYVMMSSRFRQQLKAVFPCAAPPSAAQCFVKSSASGEFLSR